ncbi:MAG: hypothetical protein MUO54_05725 [Anaerolineales bacterium]|nr:hypothetical protein [Anaerolineales bacterium]
MKTPAGFECRYFFGDYHRGKNREECRLLDSASPPLAWQAKLCDNCPVPDILRANSCEHMRLIPELKRLFSLLPQQVHVKAYCIKTQKDIRVPQIGCGECHDLPEIFLQG